MAGQVDLVENITNVSDLQRLQEDPNYTVDIASGVRCGFSWMNMEGRPGQRHLRQAILMAIDNETISNSNTIGGMYLAGFSVLPSTLAYGYENLNNPYEYDPEGAMKLLDDAGIVDTNGNGIRELNGEDITLVYYSYESRLLNEFSDAHTLYLAEIGIGVKSDYGSSSDQWDKLVAGNYDLNNNNWTTVGTGDPTEYMKNWYGKSNSNFCGYQSDEYDALFESSWTTSTPPARRPAQEDAADPDQRRRGHHRRLLQQLHGLLQERGLRPHPHRRLLLADHRDRARGLTDLRSFRLSTANLNAEEDTVVMLYPFRVLTFP